MFQNVKSYIGDPILSLMEEYNMDYRYGKVNLSIGLYYNEQGIIPQMQAVIKAQNILFSHPIKTAYSYLPMEGLYLYRKAVQTLLFGEDISKTNIATIQTVGGSGALKIGADFLKYYFPQSKVWVSNPTWENHIGIFKRAGFQVNYYPYFNMKTMNLNINEMLCCLHSLPYQSIIILHSCCHNPTGLDFTKEEWNEVITILKKRKLIPFFDIAYQGFSVGLNEDAYIIRAITYLKIPCLIIQSFSKIFSLYRERVGALSVVCNNKNEAERVLGQLKVTVRCNYSTPPNFGAQIVTYVLTESNLKDIWIKELNTMRLRIINIRKELVKSLKKELPTYDFDFLLCQTWYVWIYRI